MEKLFFMRSLKRDLSSKSEIILMSNKISGSIGKKLRILVYYFIFMLISWKSYLILGKWNYVESLW